MSIGNDPDLAFKSFCSRCANETEWSKCLVEGDDSKHGEGLCLFECSVCGERKQEGVCLRTIVFSVQISQPVFSPIPLDPEIASLVGTIVTVWSQSENLLWHMLEKVREVEGTSKRDWYPLFARDIELLKRRLPDIDREAQHFFSQAWYDKVRDVYDRLKDPRDTLAHGSLIARSASTTWVGSPPSPIPTNDEPMPLIMVREKEPDKPVELTIDNLRRIADDAVLLLQLLSG